MSGWTLKMNNGFLQTPFSKSVPALLIATGMTFVCSYLNGLNFQPIETMSPEFKIKENIIARTDAPPVYHNPIKMGLPGNILGPEDMESS